MTLNVEDRFKELLFYILKDSPYINELLEILAVPLQDSVDVMEFIRTHDSIDEAEGEQLDMRGESIGVTRPRLQEYRIFTLFGAGDTSDLDNDHGFYDPLDGTGGYLQTEKGLPDQSDPDTYMNDSDYREIIRQKASSLRSKMTRLNMFNYLLAFGARCLIDDDTTYEAVIDPIEHDDYSEWQRYYIVNHGFKPAGIKVLMEGRIRNGSSI
jgi:hypothetical protein